LSLILLNFKTKKEVTMETVEKCGKAGFRCLLLVLPSKTLFLCEVLPILSLEALLFFFYSVSKKRQEVSTKAESESQEVAEEIKYIGSNVTNIILLLFAVCSQYSVNYIRCPKTFLILEPWCYDLDSTRGSIYFLGVI
jgi:hypothetical protein